MPIDTQPSQRAPLENESAIFEGIRVIDLTQGMAGSLVTMILADYGAEVIRLEPPGGDAMWAHPAYLLWQRGKQSVNIDWASEAGRDQARMLVNGADIFIETLPPGEAGRLGLSYEGASAANPALIYLSVSAFGQQGPYRHLKAYDGIINAKSGRMRDQVGWQRGRPTYRAVNDVSYHTAMFSVQALIAALRVRQMSGKGQRLETSLLTGVTAPNNAWRRFEGQQLPPDKYPSDASTEVVIGGELVADRHESDPYTAIPSQLCAPCKDGRWIMHSVVRKDPRAVSLCIRWLKHGTVSEDQSSAIRYALNCLTGARLDCDGDWIEWYEGSSRSQGRKTQYPEPDFDSWLVDLKAQSGVTEASRV